MATYELKFPNGNRRIISGIELSSEALKEFAKNGVQVRVIYTTPSGSVFTGAFTNPKEIQTQIIIAEMERQKKEYARLQEEQKRKAELASRPPNFSDEVFKEASINPQYVEIGTPLYRTLVKIQDRIKSQTFSATGTKYDALRITAGVQERPTDTKNIYIQKSTGVETTQCTTCNLDIFLEERGYSLKDLERPINDSFWDIFKATKYTDLREAIKEREILLDAGVKVDLDLRSAESLNNFLDKLPTYRAELDDIKKNERQQSSFSLESLFSAFSSSPTVNDTQTNLLGGNQQQITTQDSITTQQQIVRDPLGSFTSIGSGVAIGVGVLALSYLLNKRK